LPVCGEWPAANKATAKDEDIDNRRVTIPPLGIDLIKVGNVLDIHLSRAR
jgi:hypothetical protein